MLAPSDGAPLVQAEAEGVGRLHRTLGTLDIVLLNIAAIISFASFSTMALAYVGLELGPILGGEIKNPR